METKFILALFNLKISSHIIQLARLQSSNLNFIRSENVTKSQLSGAAIHDSRSHRKIVVQQHYSPFYLVLKIAD